MRERTITACNGQAPIRWNGERGGRILCPFQSEICDPDCANFGVSKMGDSVYLTCADHCIGRLVGKLLVPGIGAVDGGES
jgi:hypothetical protein